MALEAIQAGFKSLGAYQILWTSMLVLFLRLESRLEASPRQNDADCVPSAPMRPEASSSDPEDSAPESVLPALETFFAIRRFFS